MRRSLLTAASLLALSGCATALEGTSQPVNIVTVPPGATCVVERNGERIGQVSPTPGILRLDKSKNDLVVRCEHHGYQVANMNFAPHFKATTFGNILAGGLVGVVVDASSGANFEYQRDMRIDMAPDARPIVAPAPVTLTEPTEFNAPRFSQ